MTVYTFTVPGKPLGKGRPRFVRKTGRSYTPDATVNAETWVRLKADEAGVRPLDGPVHMAIRAENAIPKSWSKMKRIAALASGWDERKPDADNIAKLVKDALNGIAYADDAQVTSLTVTKTFAADGNPRMTVTVTEAPGVTRC